MFYSRVLADSLAPFAINAYDRLITLQLKYPRQIHAEMMTHRVFSRNTASSRAIPIGKMISSVSDEPFIPWHWGSNRSGMQAGAEISPADQEAAQEAIQQFISSAMSTTSTLNDLGLHKQAANRYLEPAAWLTAIFTGTLNGWYGFLLQRHHPDAEPHMQILAHCILQSIRRSIPKAINREGWHLPLIHMEDIHEVANWDSERIEWFSEELWKMGVLMVGSDADKCLACISAARCARVSYLTHEGVRSLDKDLDLFRKLANQDPGHWSPMEHPSQFSFMGSGSGCYGKSWKPLRKFISREYQILDSTSIDQCTFHSLSVRPELLRLVEDNAEEISTHPHS